MRSRGPAGRTPARRLGRAVRALAPAGLAGAVLTGAVLAGALTACGSGAGGSESTSASAAAVRAAVSGVKTAGGQRQWVECSGDGSPTVVFVPGLAGTASTWDKVLPGVRATTRVCVYDRPGLGRSPRRTGTPWVDAGLHARELMALLNAAGERGPLVVVGHSYGAMVARALTRQYPARVAGVVLVDGTFPGQERAWSGYSPLWPEGGSIISLARSTQAVGDGPKMGSRPLAVVTAQNYKPNAPQWVQDLWNTKQSQAAGLSSDSVHVMALGSGHSVQSDQPATVVEAVVRVVAAARTGQRLPACSSIFQSSSTRCVQP